MIKKLSVLILAVLILCPGCSYDSGQIRLLNTRYSLWGGTPDAVTVKKGDTLYSIARRYDVPLREVVETNRLTPPYNLYVGQTIRLPTAKYHTVAKGDTLYNISKRYNVDLNSLSRTNNIQPPYSLSIGQRLLLPGSIVEKTAASSSPAPKTSQTTSSWRNLWRKKTTSASSSRNTKNTVTTQKTASVKRTAATPKTTVAKKRSTKFLWPVKGKIISSYGTIGKGRNNDGINIKAALGTTVKAADAGTIAYAGNELKGFGNLILLKHNDGWITAYAHNDKILVKKGQKVRRGEKIATVGSTGSVNTPQLHFEIRSGKKAVNPTAYLQ